MSNIQDQWFEPGDKVVRVSRFNRINSAPAYLHGRQDAIEGVVYCVTLCGPALEGYNVIHLSGFEQRFHTITGHPIGFVAANFRKVEEIRLCVEAAAKMKQPSRKEVEA